MATVKIWLDDGVDMMCPISGIEKSLCPRRDVAGFLGEKNASKTLA
jgi:hypothetical protein